MSENPFLETAPAPATTARPNRHFTIGLPAALDTVERRFPFTPDSVTRLIEAGYKVKIEKNAGERLGYNDNRYARAGAAITDRAATLSCDIIISIEMPGNCDIRLMHPGAILITLANNLITLQPDQARLLMRHKVMTIAMDLVTSRSGQRPFADALAEVDGRSAIMLAASLMLHPDGKGMLPGGVAGIIPSQVVILGSGIAARAVASSALGLGAQAVLFDSDTYSLREAQAALPSIAGSAPVPHVLENALRHADIVVATPSSRPITLHADLASCMKEAVIAIDITQSTEPAFPSMAAVEASLAADTYSAIDGHRACYVNPGNLVPRTVAMALGDSLISLLINLVDPCSTFPGIQLSDGVAKAVLTFNGHAVNPQLALIAGCRATDINILLQLS